MSYTVSGASNNGSRPAGAVGDDDRGLGVVGSFPTAPVSTTLPTMLTVDAGCVGSARVVRFYASKGIGAMNSDSMVVEPMGRAESFRRWTRLPALL